MPPVTDFASPGVLSMQYTSFRFLRPASVIVTLLDRKDAAGTNTLAVAPYAGAPPIKIARTKRIQFFIENSGG